MFCAHLDTVPHRGLVEVVDDEGVFRSRGETILGADNKAAVAVFMELVARRAETPPPVGIELVLTVAEEQGLRGAKAFDSSVLRSRVGFVLDHAGPVGEVIVATPTQQKILADFIGVEAHAGIKPEDGSSAIAAAAAAIGRMELGRLDEQTTANVGLIKGGTSGNVVPGPLLDPGRGAQPRRRPRRRGRRADLRRLRLGRERARLRRRRPARRALPRLRGPVLLGGPAAGRGGRALPPGSSRCARRSAAAATPTSSASTASTASCSPTAPTWSTPKTSTSRPPASRRCWRSARGSWRRSPPTAGRGRMRPVAAGEA